MNPHVRQTDPFRWEGIEVRPYKPSGSHFSGITRQLVFAGGEGLACELRYFEIEAGGYSSLERHQHAHAIMIIRGTGKALVGDRVVQLGTHDLVRVPPLTWHQFQATDSVSLGFLCMVDCERDRPERPDAAELAKLRADPAVAEFVRW
jgi:quercetin dioxygenase-like cupin family protein